MFLRVFLPTFFCVLLFSCSNNKIKGRYIAESDTSFTKDIRDVSARINKDPHNPELYYLRGNAFFYQDRFKDAVLDLETAVAIDSNNAVYQYKLGETMLKLDTADSRKARKHLERAVKLQPKLLDAKIALVKLMVARQEYDASEKMLKTMTGEQDVADKAFLLLGICRKEQKDTTQALTYFDKCIQVNPQNYDAAMQIALIKSAQNDKQTLAYFDRVLAINEYSDEAFYAKGLYLQKKELYKDALACYDRASVLNPAHRLSRYNAAVIYNIFEDWERSEEWCNKVLDLDPDYANALALRGYNREKMNNKKAAVADYKAALEIDPGNAPAKAGLKALGLD